MDAMGILPKKTRFAVCVRWLTLGHALGGIIALAGPATGSALVPEVIKFKVERELPHDPTAFTQGLEIWEPGYFLETTGQYGQSELRKVEIATGQVKLRKALDGKYFGEGATKFGSDIFQLTWREGAILKWGVSPKSGEPEVKQTFPWTGEGWGVTNGRGVLWLSDGTDQLKAVNPKNMKVTKTLKVTLSGKSMDRLNELEMIDGKIFANIWMTSTVVRINPKSGVIDGLMDLSELVPKQSHPDAVANGLAWDAARRRLFVTGKLWPKVYELTLLK